MAQYREAGRFAANPRKGGGLVNVTFDARETIEVTKRMVGEAARMAAASKVAHAVLAQQLQNEIAKVLEDKVAARGRAQREKPRAGRLANAIRSEENRRVSVTGYTVGYLDEIAAVRPYYRGLEEGTSRHVGRFLSGVFTTDGRATFRPGPRGGRGRPVLEAGGRDAQFIQRAPFRYERPYFPGVRIKNEIVGYRYFEGGQRNFIARGGTESLALAAYVEAFRAAGIDLLTRGLNATAGRGLPSVSGYTSQQ